jgi:hypothetical protein
MEQRIPQLDAAAAIGAADEIECVSAHS